jgi:hypothetical protein
MEGFFHNIFIFSMNAEVVHTGLAPMAHYFITLGLHSSISRGQIVERESPRAFQCPPTPSRVSSVRPFP